MTAPKTTAEYVKLLRKFLRAILVVTKTKQRRRVRLGEIGALASLALDEKEPEDDRKSLLEVTESAFKGAAQAADRLRGELDAANEQIEILRATVSQLTDKCQGLQRCIAGNHEWTIGMDPGIIPPLVVYACKWCKYTQTEAHCQHAVTSFDDSRKLRCNRCNEEWVRPGLGSLDPRLAFDGLRRINPTPVYANDPECKLAGEYTEEAMEPIAPPFRGIAAPQTRSPQMQQAAAQVERFAASVGVQLIDRGSADSDPGDCHRGGVNCIEQ